MQKPIHILLALESFFPENIGGTEYYVLHLAQNLRKNNYKVSIIKTTRQVNIYQYKYDDFDVYAFPISEKLNSYELNGFKETAGISEFGVLLKQISPDIFHLNSLGRSFNTSHLRIAKSIGIKTVFTAHLGSTFCMRNAELRYLGEKNCDGKVDTFKCLDCVIQKKWRVRLKPIAFILDKFFLSNVLKFLFPPSFSLIRYKASQLNEIKLFSDHIISISDWISKSFRLNKITNTLYISQGINTQIFRPQQILDIENKIEITFIGRIAFSKGIHLLLEAFANLKTEKISLNLILSTGVDPQYANLLHTKYDGIKNINWFMDLSHLAINDILEKTHFLCLPAIANEAAPLVILEAFSKKIPVIGSDYPAITDMVTNELTGLIFKNNSVSELQQILERVEKNPKIYYELKSNIKSVKDTSKVADDYMKIYNELTKL